MGPFLVGELLALRPLDPGDAPRLVTLLNDPAVRKSLRLDRPISLAAEHEFIAALARSTEQVVLGITAREDGRLLGVTGLHQLGDAARQAEFGIFLGGPQEWGKGYGQEATRLMVDYGFGTLNLNRIWLHVHADNLRGLHAYEKVGFRREGLLRQSVFRDGRYLDVVSMGLLREEWSPAGAAR